MEIFFTTTLVSWYTPYFFSKRNILQETVFNENLKSGQEFNFISKLLLKTNNLKIIRENLTLRMYAEDSIGVQRRKENI
jgi:hypothetical protein